MVENIRSNLTINELTKACECVPLSGIPNNLPAATLLYGGVIKFRLDETLQDMRLEV